MKNLKTKLQKEEGIYFQFYLKQRMYKFKFLFVMEHCYKIFTMIMLIWLGSFISTVDAQQMGANFNENVDDIDVNLVKHSGVTWVRGFVNIPRQFLIVEDGEIKGVKQNLINDFVKIDPFIQVKKKADVQLILSLKFEFKFKDMGVPDLNSEEMNLLMQAIHDFLVAKNLGETIDILVIGNEPMWETPNEDALKLGEFTNLLANNVADWKKENKWSFEVFGGALNRAGELQKNLVLKQIVEVVKNNDNIDGIDIHPHAKSIDQIEDDLNYIRNIAGINKKIISTEFSMVRMFDEHKLDSLGQWGVDHGYNFNMKLYEWLNELTKRTITGESVSQDEFLSYFNSTDWYVKNWFAQYYKTFEKYHASVITYRLHSSIVSDPKMLTEKKPMWLLNPLYCGQLLGKGKEGYFQENPLVFPEFQSVIKKMKQKY